MKFKKGNHLWKTLRENAWGLGVLFCVFFIVLAIAKAWIGDGWPGVVSWFEGGVPPGGGLQKIAGPFIFLGGIGFLLVDCVIAVLWLGWVIHVFVDTEGVKPDETLLGKGNIGKGNTRVDNDIWEFCLNPDRYKEGDFQIFRRIEKVKKQLESGKIPNNYFYRKFNKKFLFDETKKGDWKPISDSLYEELGLSKEVMLKAQARRELWENVGAVFGLIVIGFVVVIVIYAMFDALQNSTLHLDFSPREWTILIVLTSLWYFFRAIGFAGASSFCGVLAVLALTRYCTS